MMLGYHHDPEATYNAFKDGWYKTGDFVRVDDDGYLFLVDRVPNRNFRSDDKAKDALDHMQRMMLVTSQ